MTTKHLAAGCLALAGVLIFNLKVSAQTDGVAPVAVAKVKLETGNLAPTPPMGWNSWNTF
ncbi:hypothetical protein [Mucilaginibacter sp.]|uniref:hypothetical protein n=1 Tax=Mucilaginibacter sp. TaxID=1882438 RepID=UPI0032640DA0